MGLFLCICEMGPLRQNWGLTITSKLADVQQKISIPSTPNSAFGIVVISQQLNCKFSLPAHSYYIHKQSANQK